MLNPRFDPGPIHCGGAVFGDFRLTDHLPPDAAPGVIDRDRLRMAARPGFNRKLLPLHVDRHSGIVYSGGRYLLDTYEDARAFARWVKEEFAVDGTLFLDRPDFAEPAMRAWRVIGACDFSDVRRTQQVCRTEIWSVEHTDAAATLARLWPALRDEAANLGRSGLWLLHDEDDAAVSLFTISERLRGAERLPAADQGGPDFASIEALASTPSQGAPWEQAGWARRVFDRTDWVFNIWFPRVEGRDLESPVWPNSPPLPAPEAKISATGTPTASRQAASAA